MCTMATRTCQDEEIDWQCLRHCYRQSAKPHSPWRQLPFDANDVKFLGDASWSEAEWTKRNPLLKAFKDWSEEEFATWVESDVNGPKDLNRRPDPVFVELVSRMPYDVLLHVKDFEAFSQTVEPTTVLAARIKNILGLLRNSTLRPTQGGLCPGTPSTSSE